MKKTLITILAVLFLGSISTFANDTLSVRTIGVSDIQTSVLSAILKPDVRVVNTLEMPWAKLGLAQSEWVISKGEYAVWRVNAISLRDIPSCSPVGISYHYFVYKNGKFLLTVNDCNKDKVFDYFNN